LPATTVKGKGASFTLLSGNRRCGTCRRYSMSKSREYTLLKVKGYGCDTMGIMDDIEELAYTTDASPNEWCEFCHTDEYEHEATCILNPEVNFIDEEVEYGLEDCE